MNTARITEAFSDKEFVSRVLAMETSAEVQAALKEKGVELSEEEILAIRDLLLKMEGGEINEEQIMNLQKEAEAGELSEELLEAVSGGVVLTSAVISGVVVLKALFASAAVGATAGGIVSAIKQRW